MASQEIAPFQVAIEDSADRFKKIANQMVNFETESIFAHQMICKNDYVYGVANKAPNSVLMAMFNVASTGLTLNPAHGYAYLVPRDGQIVLDISYKGLIKIATDSGAILWARAECVYENDEFTYCGPAAMPDIKANPFKPRGEIIGAYCIAKTQQGDFLTEVMDLAAILEIRAASTAWTKGKAGSKGPWENYFPEMCRKSVIKRARKTWPYTDKDGKLAVAVDIANQAEGGYILENGEMSNEEKLAKRRAQHDEAYGRHSESIAFIKDRIEAGDLHAVADEWAAISQDDQMALWLAPTKGGCLTTLERATIKEKLPKVQQLEAQA
jgi:recombination protein RecT